tara:strand:- start:1512 stop:1667 length:156 start_codon:yes stop_codon:yes gene_type:complete
MNKTKNTLNSRLKEAEFNTLRERYPFYWQALNNSLKREEDKRRVTNNAKQK